MKAINLIQTRIVYTSDSFAELVLWRLSKPLSGSIHLYKYRLAYVVCGICVLRYDNELGKGDHRHYGELESRYEFMDVNKLIADFQADIVRWNYENNRT